jgi:hypothetical protein
MIFNFVNIKELENYIELGREASVCVDIKELHEYPGYTRLIVFYRNNRVCVEFYPLIFDVHDATIDYCCGFDSIEEAVSSIEKFLDLPVEDWTNYNKTGGYPIYVDEQSSLIISQGSYERLVKDACDKKIDLPKKGNFKLNWKIHFQNRNQYNEFLEGLDDLTKELFKQATVTYGTTA